MNRLRVQRLGRVPYAQAWELQRDLAEQRKAGTIDDTLLLLEHDPVITVGRNAGLDSVLHSPEALAARGVEFVRSDRGGDATFHGPGQVVGYPIMDLRPDWADVPRFVRALEQVMIDVVGGYGLQASRLDGAPGVWLQNPDRKIAAIGVRLSRWITHHGFALNVNTDLSNFKLIVPCGLHDKGVTSLEAELGRRISVAEVMDRVAETFADTFGRERRDT